MHFHWQSLNEDDRRLRDRRFPWHGRAWLHVTKRLTAHWEWHLRSFSCGASIGFNDEHPLTLHIALPPVSLYFMLDSWAVRSAKEWSVSVHSWALWWRFGRDPWGGWDRSVPRWRDGNWQLLDTFLGRTKYEDREIETRSVLIPMPEGAYPATVKLHVSTWKRPLWFAKAVRRATVDIPQGIPHEGKGESGYDCGTDRLYGQTSPAETVEEAIANVMQSALRSRRRYDGNVMAKYPAPTVQPWPALQSWRLR